MMHYQILITILLSTLFTTTTAQESKPFQFKLLSNTNATLDGTGLWTCHSGAAESTMCWHRQKVDPNATPNDTTHDTFIFNSTKTQFTTLPSPNSDIGHIAYNFSYANGWAWQNMGLDFGPETNLALPYIAFNSQYDIFGFNEEGFLVIWTSRDDSTTGSVQPIVPVVRAVNRWYICNSVTWAGYRYTTLAWLMGSGLPQNPTCQAVNVTRVFADEIVSGVIVPDGGR